MTPAIGFFLILTFYTDSALTSQLIPTTYTSVEACERAGQMAVSEYNGGAKINYTCVIEQN